MNQTADLLVAYSRDPLGKYKMENFDISMKQANSVCGDEVTVYLKIKDDKITDRSRDGSIEMQTTAAASMLYEEIIWVSLTEVLDRNYQLIKDLWLELSPRRKRSWVTALLATKNALHTWLDDEIVESFEDIL